MSFDNIKNYEIIDEVIEEDAAFLILKSIVQEYCRTGNPVIISSESNPEYLKMEPIFGYLERKGLIMTYDHGNDILLIKPLI